MKRAMTHERGETLLEMLVAVTIMAITFVALISGMITASVTSDYHRKQATAGIALRDYAEQVKLDTYANCATTSSYGSAYSAPSGYSKSITTVEYYAASTSSPATGTFQGSCPSTDQGVQRVTLQIQSSDAHVTETLVVVKRCTGARPAVCA